MSAMDIVEHLILLTISLISNLLSAMAGGGTGLLQLPALIFLELPFVIALATHKIATVALGVGATAKHIQEKHVQRGFALLMLASGLPGVILGANIILEIPEYLAKLMLGILTIGIGAYSLLHKTLGNTFKPKHRDTKGMLVGCLGLFILGVFNGSLTSGTGLFVTMWLISWFGFDYKRATAYTLIMVGLFWNGAGATTLALQAPVKWSWLPMLLLGSVVGGYFGAHIAIKYGNPLIKTIFQIVTILVGISLIYASTLH